jgi:hypothetical protein
MIWLISSAHGALTAGFKLMVQPDARALNQPPL